MCIRDRFDTCYYLFRQKEFNRLLKSFDDITENKSTSRLIQNDDVRFILKKAKRFNFLAKCGVLWLFIQTVGTSCVFLFLHFMYSQTTLFLPIPYSLNSEIVFLLTLSVHMVSGFFAAIKMACSWGVMFIFLYHTVLYLKGLRKVFYNNFQISAKTEQYWQKEIKHNIRIHNESEIHLKRKNTISLEGLSCYEFKTSVHGLYITYDLRDWLQTVSYTHLDVYKRQQY